MHDTEVAASNARTLAQAVTAVATEIARTGIEIASIHATRAYGDTIPMRVSVQARNADDLPTLARLFPGLPMTPHEYGGNAKHEGRWTGMGITVNVYGPTAEQVTA